MGDVSDETLCNNVSVCFSACQGQVFKLDVELPDLDIVLSYGNRSNVERNIII